MLLRPVPSYELRNAKGTQNRKIHNFRHQSHISLSAPVNVPHRLTFDQNGMPLAVSGTRLVSQKNLTMASPRSKPQKPDVTNKHMRDTPQHSRCLQAPTDKTMLIPLVLRWPMDIPVVGSHLVVVGVEQIDEATFGTITVERRQPNMCHYRSGQALSISSHLARQNLHVKGESQLQVKYLFC